MTSKPFRILSLSGGGVRGVFQASYLKRISEYVADPLAEYFDLIAGTSTGAIVGLATALRVDPARIVDFYSSHASTIFRARVLGGVRKGPRYDQRPLRTQLRSVFGSKQLRDCTPPVVITAVSVDQFRHRVFSTITEVGSADGNLSAVDVALASAAAPTYFQPVRPDSQVRAYLDGGMWANSPSTVAILYAHQYLGVQFEDMRLLAIGTGDFPSGAVVDDFDRLRPLSPAAIRLLFEVMFASQQSFANENAQRIIGPDNVVRVSSNLDEPIALDDIDMALKKLPALAEAEADRTIDQVKEMFLHEHSGHRERHVRSGPKLVDRKLIEAAGLTAFYPSRNYYATYRSQTATIDSYVATARKTVVLVSVNLMTGLPFDGLRTILDKMLENRTEPVSVSISLLDPRQDALMSAMAPVLDTSAQSLAEDISDTLKRLLGFRGGLSAAAQSRLQIRVHKAIPFGSAILIDHREGDGRIQIETKPYKAPVRKSFAFEVASTGSDGLYEALANGFEELLRDGEVITLETLSG